jgi:hypothetical protein
MEVWNDGLMASKPNIPKFHHSIPLITVGLCHPPGGETL